MVSFCQSPMGDGDYIFLQHRTRRRIKLVLPRAVVYHHDFYFSPLSFQVRDALAAVPSCYSLIKNIATVIIISLFFLSSPPFPSAIFTERISFVIRCDCNTGYKLSFSRRLSNTRYNLWYGEIPPTLFLRRCNSGGCLRDNVW